MIKKGLVFFILLVQVSFVSFSKNKTDRKTEFQQAIDKNDMGRIEKLMKKSSVEEKIDALMLAVSSGKKDFVSLFLDSGVDVNSFDKNYNTPLITACSRTENFEIIEFLLEKGAAVNAKNSFQTTPLLAACRVPNNDRAVKLLLEHGADINKTQNSGDSILFYAIENQNRSLMELLLEQNADVNVALSDGETPLIRAVNTGNADIISLLLKHGADIHAGDDMPLFVACMNKSDDLIRLLLEHGAKINAKNESGETPLIYGAKQNSDTVVSLLVENKAEVNASDNEGGTALYYALKNNNTEMAKILLSHKASISMNGDKGAALAEIAEENRSNGITELLKKYGYVPAPTELWNGFTDQMTVNQVIARADKLLNAKESSKIYEPFKISSIYAFKEELPEPEFIAYYRSLNTEFYQDLSRESNVLFYFYKNHLYGVEIRWNLSIKKSVIEKAKENYGSNFYIKKHRDFLGSFYWEDIAYIWNKNYKEVFLCSTAPNTPGERLKLFVFSKSLVQQYQSDLKVKQENERRKVEEERRKNAANIKF